MTPASTSRFRFGMRPVSSSGWIICQSAASQPMSSNFRAIGSIILVVAGGGIPRPETRRNINSTRNPRSRQSIWHKRGSVSIGGRVPTPSIEKPAHQ